MSLSSSATSRRAGHACEICGAGEDRATGRWLEAHERWSYDEQAGVQALRRLICLCSPCHLVTHFGHANVTGRTDDAFAHLQAVTGMNRAQAVEHVRAAERLWLARSGRVWELDMRILTDAGVTLARPEPAAADRPAAAERALRREQTRQAAIPTQREAAVEQPAQPRPAVPTTRVGQPARRRGFWARLTGKA